MQPSKSSKWSKFKDTLPLICGAVALIGVLWLWCTWATQHAPRLAMAAITTAVEAQTAYGKIAPPKSGEKAPEAPQVLPEAKVITMAALGQTGDLFGGLNTLFAGLAFTFVAVAAALQYRTLAAQREQMQEAKQHQSLVEFEPLFFQLVDLFRSQAKDARLKVPVPGGGYASDLSLQVPGLLKDMEDAFAHVLPRLTTQTADSKAYLLTKYDALYADNSATLGPLFRTLYHCFRLVQQAEITEKQKVRYANIARGLLAGNLLRLLFLNCLSEKGEGFKPYVEYFGLLKHADSMRPHAQAFYAPTATMSHAERVDYWKTHPKPVLPE